MSNSEVPPSVDVAFAREVDFDIEAIKRAAYRYSDKISVEIIPAHSEIICRITDLAKNGTASLDLDFFVAEFRNEVLDQDLRIKLAAETERYRNLILSLAFSKTSLGA